MRTCDLDTMRGTCVSVSYVGTGIEYVVVPRESNPEM
jgi:hypothetical protein